VPIKRKHVVSINRRARIVARASAMLVILASVPLPAWPQSAPDLADRSLEDLMNVEVTSVSKKEQTLSRTAAAVFVITQEDIRRSGAINIPDLLRMVPGLDVAQIDANTWAISARGLNGQFSNELLVLLDGRNVYTPTFGGVFWDALDLPLENIERIEVIRGPGGTIWGANAVNGVINIITKKAADTKRTMVVAGGGNIDDGFGTVQYGGSAGKSTDYRVYTKYLNQDHFPGIEGQNGGDGWHVLRGGFRSDTELSPKDTLTVEGAMYSGREGDPTIFFPSVTSPGPVNIEMQVDVSGGYIQSVWNHVYSSRSDSSLRVSYDGYSRHDVLREDRRTFSADFQHHFAWGSRQDVVWALGYGYSSSDTDGNLTFSLNPADLNTQLFSAFVQDEIALIPNRLYITAGTKLEHNYYTGFGLMPSARVTYSPSVHHMVWAAVSRALRTPASTDTASRTSLAGFTGTGGVPVLISLLGNPDFQNEQLIAYEAGYRTTLSNRFSIDFAASYNDYDNQRTTEPAAPFFESTPLPPHIVAPLTYKNLGYQEEHGFEVAANWKVTTHWTVSPGYDFERIHAHVSAASQDTVTALETEGSDPHVHAQLRSHFDLSRRLTWDASAYFTNRLLFQDVPAYTRLDTGLSWQWKEGISLSLVGQNLLKDHHLEFVDSVGATRSAEIKRSVYTKFTWLF
jgi:iron complex outermembrane recepter protein